jgi:hypothetical protein
MSVLGRGACSLALKKTIVIKKRKDWSNRCGMLEEEVELNSSEDSEEC